MRRFTQHSKLKLTLEKIIKSNVYFYKFTFEIKKYFFKSLFHEEDLEGLKKIDKNVRKEMNIIDVGGNVGQSIHFFKKYFNNIYTFEPNKKNFDFLKKKFKKFPNIHLYNFGLGSKETTIELHIPYYKNLSLHQSASFSKTEAKNTLNEFLKIPKNKIVFISEDIKIRTLDSFNLKKIDIIKIDTEGYENEVLKGMINILKEDVLIIIEYSDKSFDESLKILSENNFLNLTFYKNKFISDSPNEALNIYFVKNNTKKFKSILNTV